MPERYNIAADVCDKHPRDKLAMIHEDFGGDRRARSHGASCRTARTRSPTCSPRTACGRGDRVAVVLPPTPETAAVFFGTWKRGAILLSMSVLYGDEGIRHRLEDSQAKVLVTDAANRGRFDGARRERPDARRRSLRRASTAFETVDTRADDPAQLYYTSGTTGLAKGIIHAHRYLLAHEEFIYCHEVQDGERFHGMGEWAWAAGHRAAARPVAPRRGPVRLPARGRLRPAQQLDFLVAPRGRRTSSRRRPRCAR